MVALQRRSAQDDRAGRQIAPPGSERRALRVVEIVAPLLWIMAAGRTLASLSTVVRLHEISDFATFYNFAFAARAHLNPYRADPVLATTEGLRNLNAPIMAVIAEPLTLLPPTWAFLAWTIVSLAGFAWAVRLVQREVSGSSLVVIVALLLIPAPGALSVRLGQVTGVLSVLAVLAWRAARQNRWTSAGAWLGALILLKPFLVPLALILIARCQWRALGVAIGAAAIVLACGLVALPAGTLSAWIALLQHADVVPNRLNASIAGVVARATHETLTLHAIRNELSMATSCWIAGTGLVVASALYGGRHAGLDRQWGLAIVAALLISPLGWIYYLPLALGPLIALAPVTPLAIGSLVLLSVPWEWIISFGWEGPVLGSVYGWGLIMLFAALCLQDRSRHNSELA